MRMLAPLVRTLTALAVLVPSMAGAVTLEEYFFGFSDRDRGVYITGVLDLFAADSSRDPEYRHCVDALGVAGMHKAISEIVREDPRLLSFDAALWILFEASRRCNTAAEGSPVPDPRSMLGAADEPAAGEKAAGDKVAGSSGVPDLTAGSPPKSAPAAWLPDEWGDWDGWTDWRNWTGWRDSSEWSDWRDWRLLAGGALLLLLVVGLVVMFRRSRGRRRRFDPARRFDKAPRVSFPRPPLQ